MNHDYEVAIVGGGHNALVAACYLAQAGKKVIVLEKNKEFGGATKSVYAFEGIGAKLSRYSSGCPLSRPDQRRFELRVRDFK